MVRLILLYGQLATQLYCNIIISDSVATDDVDSQVYVMYICY